MRAQSSNRLLVGAAGVLMLGFLLRTPGLSLSSLWLDEIHSYERASQQSWQAVYKMLRSSGHAPLYEAVLLHYWMKLGTSEFMLRFPSVVVGILNIAATYSLGKEIFNAQVGLLSAFLLAASPLHVYYSQEARMYTLAAFLTTLGIYSAFRASFNANSASTWRYRGAYVLFAALSLYTHYFTGFALLVILVFGVIRLVVKRSWSALLPLLLAYFVIGLLFAPWLRTVWAQLQGPRLTWIPPITIHSLLDVLARFFINQVVLGWAYPVLVLALTLALAAGLFVRRGNRKQRTNAGERGRHLFVLACAVGPILVAIAVSLFKPMVVDRYFLIVVPPACILLALGVTRLSRHYATIPIALVLAMGMLVSAFGVGAIRWKEDWRGVAAYIMDNSVPDDVIVLVPGGLRLPFDYYYDGSLERYGVPDNLASASEVEQEFDNFEPFTRLWMVRAERFQVSDQIVDYIAAEYSRYLVSCRQFGGFYGIDLCLYTGDDR